jgi:trehalose/maltose hydrolase-like predicted phosphorylase
MIDLTGESKQYAGTIYIGGTHPAANGGAWMAAVLGFAGVRAGGRTITVKPQMPEKWESIALHLVFRGQDFSVEVRKNEVRVKASAENKEAVLFDLCGEMRECGSGQEIRESF